MRPADVSRSTFGVLWREFFAQFFTSETVASEHQFRRALFGVLAFLVTPGFVIPVQLDFVFEFTALRFPTVMPSLIHMMATIFLTYSVVAVGVVTALEWEGLGFDRRDAMILGPLPVPGRTIIAAKLAALGALLLVTAGAINVITAGPFSIVSAARQPLWVAGRYFVAHVIATMAAATFFFALVVTARAVLGMLGLSGGGLATLLQFVVVSALLCLLLFVPTAMQIDFRPHPVVHLQQVPAWLPTRWFVAVYEVARGAGTPALATRAAEALGAMVAAVVLAAAATVASYRRQFSVAMSAGAAGRRSAAPFAAAGRLLAGGAAAARGVSDFVVLTLLRRKPQQAPVAVNAAIGVVMIVLTLSSHHDALVFSEQSRRFAVPLMFAFWTLVGLRAAFFIPADIPASWMLRSAAAGPTRDWRRGVVAAVVAMAGAPAIFLALLVASPSGPAAAARHAVFVLAAVTVLAALLALTIDFVPFTRPYEAGHARLRTRWPLYLIGAYVYSFGLTAIELACTTRVALAMAVAALVAAAAVALAARRRALPVRPEEFDPDEGLWTTDATVLNLGLTLPVH